MFDLDAYLAEHIPLTRAMGLKLVRHDAEGLELLAPLAPNVNDKGTAFAGALASIATLAGWALTQLTLERAGHHASVMVVSSQTEYLRPVREALRAVCPSPGAAAEATLLADFAARGKARWTLTVSIDTAAGTALRMSSEYVAVRAA